MFTKHRTTRIAICCCAAVLAGCAKKNDAADTTAVASTASTTTTTTPPPAPTPLKLADVAGKWNMRAVPASGDTSATTYVLTATNSTTGWSFKFPGRPVVPVQVIADGDSVALTAGPYLSVRRKGVQVRTNGVLRFQGGALSGTTTAHYSVKTADSVLVLNVSGTKAQ